MRRKAPFEAQKWQKWQKFFENFRLLQLFCANHSNNKNSRPTSYQTKEIHKFGFE